MKNLKKVVALIAAFAMIMSTAVFANSFPDVTDDSAAAEAIDVLSDIGVFEGDELGNFNPDAIVTRAEMATLVARIQGYEGDIAQSATNFADVPANYWASGYIALAAGQGIVNGYGDGNFGPDDSVKYEEAIKMIMVTLGYEPMAQEQGGYPAGYIAAANSQRVLSGVVGGVQGQGCPRSTIAMLLYNAIDTALMIRTGYGSESTYVVSGTYSDVDRQTLMGEYMDISKLKGFVLSDGITSISSANMTVDTNVAQKAEIRVTGNYQNNGSDKYGSDYVNAKTHPVLKFRVGDSNVSDYLGRPVVFYVQEDNYDDDDVIVSIVEDSTKSDELTFTVDQFDSYDGVTTLRYFKNATDQRATQAKVQDTVSSSTPVYLVYNGVSVGAMTSLTAVEDALADNFGEGAKVAPNSTVGGKVTLYETDGVTGYDVIMIEIAATAVVDEINNGRLTFKGSDVGMNQYDNVIRGSIDFDSQDSDFVCTITKDGEEIEYTELEEWDVLSIIYNENRENVYDIRVVSNQIDGKINSTKPSDTSATGRAYVIDGTEYDAAQGWYPGGASTLKAGSAGMFYIDEYGKIAAYDRNGGTQASTIASDNYGYVLKAVDDADIFDNQTVSVKMLTNKKGMVTLDMASNVKVTQVGVEDVNYRMEDGDGSALVKRIQYRLLRFGVNSNGAINNIELASEDGDEGDFTLAGTFEGEEYDEDSQRLGRKYDIDENTIVFYIGSTGTMDLEVNDDGELVVKSSSRNKPVDDDCSISTGADLFEGAKISGSVYDEDSSTGVAKVVVIYNETGMVAPSSAMAVIDSVANSVDDEVNEILEVNYYQDGKPKQAYTTAAFMDNDLSGLEDAKRGDIYKFSFNENGDITKASANVVFNDRKNNVTYDNLRTEIGEGDFEIPEIKTALADINKTKGDGQEYVAGIVTDYKPSNGTVTLTDPDHPSVSDSFKLSNATIYVYKPALKSSNRLFEGNTSYLSFDKDLVNDSRYTKINDKNGNKLADVPAYEMLPYVVVRLYDGRVEEALVVLAYEYRGYKPVTAADEKVPATKVTLSEDTTEVTVDETVELTATVTPSGTTDTIDAESSDPSKATVSVSGKTITVKGVATTVDAEGKDTPVTITVTAGKQEATCKVTVKAAATAEPTPGA